MSTTQSGPPEIVQAMQHEHVTWRTAGILKWQKPNYVWCDMQLLVNCSLENVPRKVQHLCSLGKIHIWFRHADTDVSMLLTTAQKQPLEFDHVLTGSVSVYKGRKNEVVELPEERSILIAITWFSVTLEPLER